VVLICISFIARDGEHFFITQEFSGVQSSWVHSENESTGGLQAAEVRKILFVEKRREKLHGGMQWDPETSGPVGQVGNWVFIAFFCIAQGWQCLSGLLGG
jgi:hypothetical protein